MVIVGERINSSRKDIARAIERRDANFIQNEAKRQAEAGADYIDVNAGTFLEDEAEHLAWLVKTVSQSVNKPLCIDTPNPIVLSAALKSYSGRAMINSITAETKRRMAFLPLIKQYPCKVVALCVDDSGIPRTAEAKTRIAGQIISGLTAAGVIRDDIYIDPVVQSIGTDSKSGIAVLEAIEQIVNRYPGVHTICGLSNISFGLPLRTRLNRVFLVLAMQRGLDAAIIDPCDMPLMADLVTVEALLGQDDYCQNYIAAYRQAKQRPSF